MIQGEGFVMIECFVMSCKTYIKEAFRVVEKRMVDFNLFYLSTRRHGKDASFFSSTKRPECEESGMGSEDEITLHINLIWMSRWVCELGCTKMYIEHCNLKDAKENWLEMKECYVRNT